MRVTLRSHLLHYEAENRPPPPPPPPPYLYPYAWVGCVLYVLVLLGVAAALTHALVRLDAFDVGRAGCGARAGRTMVARVDGADPAPGWAAPGGESARRRVVRLSCRPADGSRHRLAAHRQRRRIANLLEGLHGPPDHRSVGASTAVFAALGAMSAFSWRERLHRPQRWVRRWGPLVAGVILLGWTGSAGEGTDLIAHVAGFGVGALLGATVALPHYAGVA